MKNNIYTIGHSNRELNEFLELLRLYCIEYLIDVRYTPYSRYVTQYNKGNLDLSLRDDEIRYIYLGHLLGIDYSDENFINQEGHYLDYEKVSRSAGFLKGIDAVLEGVEQGYHLALMCSERDPIDCHRGILISRVLQERGNEVDHINDYETELENHRQLEERLLALYNKNKSDDQLELFPAEEITLERAYRLQNISMSYKAMKEAAK